MFYPESHRFKNVKIANIVCERTFRHIVRKLTKNATCEPSTCFDNPGTELPSVSIFHGVIYEFGDWRSAKLFSISGISLDRSSVHSSYSGIKYLKGSYEYNSFIRDFSLRMCYEQIKGMSDNQEFHYRNKTSYKKHKIAQSINKLGQRNTAARELATMGLLI